MDSDLYKPPESDLGAEDPEPKPTLWIWIILGHMYFWPKLIDYIGLFQYVLDDNIALLRLCINIPIYFAFLFFIIQFKFCFRVFFRVWILIAVSDETYQFIQYWSGNFIEELIEIAKLAPLYFVGYLYSYRAKHLWDLAGCMKFYWLRKARS